MYYSFLLQLFLEVLAEQSMKCKLKRHVWAAGFTTALLKKSSSATHPSNEPERELELVNGSKIEEKEPIFFIETLLLFTFEKLFSYLLNLPDINRTGDKVIPFRAVESFIDDQMRKGKRVISFNFGSSPHVDHYRTFPDVYSSQLQDFLKELSPDVYSSQLLVPFESHSLLHSSFKKA